MQYLEDYSENQYDSDDMEFSNMTQAYGFVMNLQHSAHSKDVTKYTFDISGLADNYSKNTVIVERQKARRYASSLRRAKRTGDNLVKALVAHVRSYHEFRSYRVLYKEYRAEQNLKKKKALKEKERLENERLQNLKELSKAKLEIESNKHQKRKPMLQKIVYPEADPLPDTSADLNNTRSVDNNTRSVENNTLADLNNTSSVESEVESEVDNSALDELNNTRLVESEVEVEVDNNTLGNPPEDSRERSSETCSACKQKGHRKNNQSCPLFQRRDKHPTETSLVHKKNRPSIQSKNRSYDDTLSITGNAFRELNINEDAMSGSELD